MYVELCRINPRNYFKHENTIYLKLYNHKPDTHLCLCFNTNTGLNEYFGCFECVNSIEFNNIKIVEEQQFQYKE
jgi:hypothetical protein